MSGGLGGPPQLNHALTRIYKGTLRHQPEGPKNMVEGRVQSCFLEEKLKPIFSIDPVYDAVLRNGGGGILPPVNQRILQCLTTVLAQVSVGNGSSTGEVFSDIVIKGQRFAGPMTLRQFMGLDGQGQMAVIDAGWNRICAKKAYDKFSSMMWEPNTLAVDAATTPVPSGAVPGPGTSMLVGYRGEKGLPDAFCGLGVGFRCDGSGDNCERDIERVLRDGMTTQLKNEWLMRNVKGWEVQGTTVDLDTNAPRVWATKNDLFNESAVCISRNLYGATAFPERDMRGRAVLWAVDVSGLVGFDTEEYQKTLNRQWRPGEKAFSRIPAGNVMGHVFFEKCGGSEQGGWTFKIPADAKWTWRSGWEPPLGFANIRGRSYQARDYATAQLEAWRGVERVIGGAYDFA
jgi:hypothetical protein